MIAFRRSYLIVGLAIVAASSTGVAWRMAGRTAATVAPMACSGSSRSEMIIIPGGTAILGGSDAPDDAPPRRVTVPGFRIDATEVTNTQFAEFVRATGYVTLAERAPRAEDHPELSPELLVPGSAVFVPPSRIEGTEDISQWWRFTPGANWRHPNGADSNISGRENMPVVHVAYEDALAYARWRGHSLPTEAQWEIAARGGLDQKRYAWGDELVPDGIHRANVWQGAFPLVDTGGDGFKGAAPVGCFEANGYGLHDMIGNVWEWTTGSDPATPGTRIIKGGSFLCAPNYCARYRPAARQFGDPSLGASHIGFRTVAP